MIKSKFLCVMEKNATTEANEITVGEIRPLTNAELRIMEGTTFFLRSYAINGNFAGYLFHGANGPINPVQSLELVKGREVQEATALNPTMNSNKPFVYRGNLSNGKLIEWLNKIVRTLEGERSTKKQLADLKEDMELHQSTIKKSVEFISANVYPTHQDPIQDQDTQSSAPCKNEAHNHQGEHYS